MKKEEGDLRKLSKIFESQGTGYDWGIIASVIFLTSMGVLMVYSTSSVFALEKFGDSSYFLKRHAIYLSLGFAVMIILMKLNYSVLRSLVYPAYVIGLVILALVLIPGVSKEIGGARRWINLGIWSFQPAEIAKFLLIFYFSYSLMKKKEKMDTFLIGFVSHLVIAGSYIILILLEPDFGMAAILLIVLFGMLFIGGANMRYLAFSSFVAVIFLVWAVMSEDYRMNRVTTFLNPWKDPLGSGYQAVQSFTAFGLGGIQGTGLGDSIQKLLFLPEAHTDFIFSIIGEELGFIGVVLIIFGFGFLMIRGIRVALRAPDLFGCYLVFGCIMLVTLQAGVNMAVAVGLFPTKGLTLPFISYGGTSLLSSLAAMGIVLSVSRYGVK
ncbi:MAG: putative lipid II flippase FtsW [Thermodesulfobacteriota bacterium]